MYFRQSRAAASLELIHQTPGRNGEGHSAAELPLDLDRVPKATDPKDILMHGIVWVALSAGAVLAFWLIPNMPFGLSMWPVALPLLFLGIGLILYYVLVSDRRR